MNKELSEHPAVKAARLYGIDTSLLIENLRRTPTERVERLRQRLQFSEELKRAGSKKTSIPKAVLLNRV